MIRTNQIVHRPLYRVIVPASLRSAWKERWLWPIALLAGLIQTGGIMDALLISTRDARFQAVTLFDASWGQSFAAMWARVAAAPDWIGAILAGQSLFMGAVVVIATLALALIAQGALVFGIGGQVRGRKPGFRECLRMGTRMLGRILALNIITLGLSWLARFLMVLPLGLYAQDPTPGLALASVGMSILYVVVVLSLTAVHFFALNALVLQESHVAKALERGLRLLRDSWLTVIEIAVILFSIGIATMAVALVLFLVMWLPLFLLMLGTALLNMTALFSFLYFLSILLFLLIMLMAGAFNLSFQYRAWHHLFLRLGEGGAVAKLHRWLHALLSYGQ